MARDLSPLGCAAPKCAHILPIIKMNVVALPMEVTVTSTKLYLLPVVWFRHCVTTVGHHCRSLATPTFKKNVAVLSLDMAVTCNTPVLEPATSVGDVASPSAFVCTIGV